MKPYYTRICCQESGLTKSARKAGTGMACDDYGDESGNPEHNRYCGQVRFPNDSVKTEKLNGPVIIVQKGRKRDGEK